jgi:hypothetical protein
MKLSALALSPTTSIALDAYLDQLESSRAKLKTTAISTTTNLDETRVGLALKESAINIYLVIQEWLQTIPNDDDHPTPFVMLCGDEGQLLAKLRSDHSNIIAPVPAVQEFVRSGVIRESIEQCDFVAPSNTRAKFQMVFHPAAIHAGVLNVLMAQRQKLLVVGSSIKTDANVIRENLVGQRVVVVSNDNARGTIILVNQSSSIVGSDDELRNDTFTVFIDAEKSFIDVSYAQLIGTLLVVLS